jgi:hypothetical protein
MRPVALREAGVVVDTADESSSRSIGKVEDGREQRL